MPSQNPANLRESLDPKSQALHALYQPYISSIYSCACLVGTHCFHKARANETTARGVLISLALHWARALNPKLKTRNPKPQIVVSMFFSYYPHVNPYKTPLNPIQDLGSGFRVWVLELLGQGSDAWGWSRPEECKAEQCFFSHDQAGFRV